MEYRKLPRGGEKISIIGIGTSSTAESSQKEIEATVNMALEKGINYFDMAAADTSPFLPFGRAFEGNRKNVYLQVHFGAEYSKGTYGWTMNLDSIKKSVDEQLTALKTDYMDFGFIHCIDEMADLDKALSGGTLQYIQELQKQGVVKHIGLSTHTPAVADKVLDMDLIDMLMFSINPAYDYRHGDYAFGKSDERMELYRKCQAKGVGISVMKAFAGGQLLNEATSPIGVSLTESQCLQYALDKPGVLTVLPGVRDRQDLTKLLDFFNASPEQKDYSVLGTLAPKEVSGVCVYCNHCQPCPEGLDVGLINKYYDLTLAGDALARNHYENLEKKASDCIACGHCDSRCPFKVKQSQRMKEISQYFGK